MTKVRTATKQDIPECARLLGVLFSQEQEFTPETEAQERGLDMIVSDPSVGTVFVYERDGIVIGMVSLLSTVSTALGRRVALLEDMVVRPEYRNQGIGSMLIEHAGDWAWRQGFGRITLLTDGDNEPAHRFYAAKGYSRSDMTIFRKSL
jgi:GNAT superfamily N-acetyltransferase